MSDWKDDKDKGPAPWRFSPQADKWGYLNNPRWRNTPGPTVNYTGRPGDEPQIWTPGGVGGRRNPLNSNQHFPCGHWHKRTFEYPTILLDMGFTQQSMDIFHGRVACCGMLTDDPHGLVCCEGTVDGSPTDWYFLGQANGISQYLEPSTLRISSERGYIGFFGSFMPWDGNTDHLGMWKFERDYYPTFKEAWFNDYVDDWLDDYQIYNIGDCYLDRAAMAARWIKKGGVAYGYWEIAVSNNGGDTWSYWTFPTGVSSYGGAGYQYDRVQLRISQDQSIWAAYLRSAGVTGDHMIELWKAAPGSNSFSKIWETNFYAALGSDAYGFNFDIEDYFGEQLVIHLMGTTGGVYTQLIYYLTNYGTAVVPYSHTYAYADAPFSKGVADAPVVVHGANNDVFLRSVNGGAAFNSIPESRLSGSYVEHQKHHSEQIYTECSKDFGVDPDFMGYLYSANAGLTWKAIQTPFGVGTGPAIPITLTAYPGFVDEFVSENEVRIHDVQTGDYRTVSFNTMPGLFQGRDYRTVTVTDVPWG